MCSSDLTASDSATVAPSVFNAAVSDTVQAVDSILAYAVFVATIQAGATAADQIVGAFLWNVINDAQTAGWGNVNDAQTAGWGTLNTAQSASWATIQDSQSASWSTVNDSQTTNWQNIKTQT